MGLLQEIRSFWGTEKGGKNDGFIMDKSVEELGPEAILQLTRQTTMLSRRRRCATEHLGGNLGSERSVAFALEAWYLNNGLNKQTATSQQLSDLQAVFQGPDNISCGLKKRILLTNYFSATEDLEDCYKYGDINPFIFGGEKVGIIGLSETFQDRMSFVQRVETISSFDPEIKGFRHQIRYFRALLATYGIAHLLKMKKIDDPLIHAVCADEKALARGWLSLDKKMEEFSINPFQLPPDESWLYDRNKVSESAALFKMYARFSKESLS